MVSVFFKLNGQPRRARIPDRTRGAASKVHRYLDSMVRDRTGGRHPVLHLGGIVFEIGLRAIAAQYPLIAVMRMQRELRDEIDQPVALSVWSNKSPTIVHVEDSIQSSLSAISLRRRLMPSDRCKDKQPEAGSSRFLSIETGVHAPLGHARYSSRAFSYALPFNPRETNFM